MISQRLPSSPNEPQNVFRVLDDMQEQLKYLRRHMSAYAALRRLEASFAEAPQANQVKTPILKWTLVEPPDLLDLRVTVEVETDLDLLPDPSRLTVVKAMAAVHAQAIKKFTASFLVNATVVTEGLAKTGDTDEPSREAGKSGG